MNNNRAPVNPPAAAAAPAQQAANAPAQPANRPASAAAQKIVNNPTTEYKPTSAVQNYDMFKDPIVKRFPMSDRMSLAMRCCSAKLNTSTALLKKEELFKFEKFFTEENKKNLALRLSIQETGSLLLDPHVVHPFVRVHIMDMKTNKYLAKKVTRTPGCANKESAATINANGVVESKEVDYLQPLATKIYDMRIKGQNSCIWNEDFIINEYAEHFLNPNCLILFEILDFNFSLIQSNSKHLTHELFYPVAWAYLRPLGTAHIHMSRSRLQLFKYKMIGQPNTKNTLTDHRTPSVFLEFNWPVKTKYPSYIEVNLSFSGKTDNIIPRRHFSRAPWEEEIGLYDYADEMIMAKAIEARAPTSGKDFTLNSWRKGNWPSMLPNQLLYRLDTEQQGCLRVAFSNQGQYLAMACTMDKGSSKTIIKLIDLHNNGEVRLILRGHHDLIHDLHFSSDDNYLVSASADGGAKVWDLTAKDTTVPNMKNYEENDETFFWCQLMHPSYVYAAKFYPDPNMHSERDLIVVTVCYDSRVRFWKVPTESMPGQNVTLLRTVSIKDENARLLKSKNDIYHDLDLDDQALRTILRPETRITHKTVASGANLDTNNEKLKKINFTLTAQVSTSIFDMVHPNCLTINELGRVFVGDSRGQIHFWDAGFMNDGKFKVENHVTIRHKELDGDQINSIVALTEPMNTLQVHSRDNCIRLIEYESSRGPRVKARFFGTRCSNMPVSSAMSTDGQFIISGSEDGKPKIWDTSFESMLPSKYLACELLDVVSDCCWNPQYNMFALSGFSENFPVLVYVYQRTEEEQQAFLMGGGLQTEMEKANDRNQAAVLHDEDRQTRSVRKRQRSASMSRGQENMASDFSNRRAEVPTSGLKMGQLPNF